MGRLSKILVFVVAILSFNLSPAVVIAWTLKKYIDFPAPNTCKLFLKDHTLYVRNDWQGSSERYHKFEIDKVGNQIIDQGPANSDANNTLRHTHSISTNGTIYMEPSDSESPFGGSVITVHKGNFSDALTYEETLARPYGYRSSATKVTADNSVAMLSAFWQSAEKKRQLLIFDNHRKDWRFISNVKVSSNIGNLSFSRDGKIFGFTDGDKVTLFNVNRSGISPKGELLSTKKNFRSLSLSSKYAMTTSWNPSEKVEQITVYSLENFFDEFDNTSSSLLIPIKIPKSIASIRDDAFILSYPLHNGPVGGKAKGAVVIIEVNDFNWSPSFTYLPTNLTSSEAQIGSCVKVVDDRTIVFTEFVNKTTTRLHLLVDERNNLIKASKKIDGPKTSTANSNKSSGVSKKNFISSQISLLEPNPHILHIASAEEMFKFYYVWTHSPSNNQYNLKQWIPDTTSLKGCSPRSITNPARTISNSISSDANCSFGKCYYIGWRAPTRKCDKSSFQQSWQVTPFGGTPSQKITFNRVK